MTAVHCGTISTALNREDTSWESELTLLKLPVPVDSSQAQLPWHSNPMPCDHPVSSTCLPSFRSPLSAIFRGSQRITYSGEEETLRESLDFVYVILLM